jgi:hypothetical protein
MSVQGQKHVLPRRSITACVSSNSGHALRKNGSDTRAVYHLVALDRVLIETAAIAIAGPLVHLAVVVDRQCFQCIAAGPIAHETNYIRLSLIQLQAGLAVKGLACAREDWLSGFALA